MHWEKSVKNIIISPGSLKKLDNSITEIKEIS